ncbi:MAG: O-antigen ligase family protein, partial [Desulfohalobium sp.]
MGEVLLYLLMAGTCLAALARPWIGVMAAYVFVVLGPQHIWWWNFQGIRPFFTIAIATIIGIVLAATRGDIDFSFLKTKINGLLLLLFVCITLSYFFGAYINGGPGPRFYNPEMIYERIMKIYIFYFLAVLCITDDKKFKYLSLVMVFSIMYLVYWANNQYLIGNWGGRLGGPRSIYGGHYVDENGFAMLFVMGLPFLYYIGYYFKSFFLRYGMWLIIPFGWHAIFLTGSRGGLVGLGLVMLMTALRSPKKWIGLLLIPAFIFAYQWQAGSVMQDRATGITQTEQTTTAQTRFQAWDAAWEMMKSHPLFGVGVASMGPAFPDFSPHSPRVAHNAYFQTGAESGMVAFLAYGGVFALAFLTLWNRKPLRSWKDQENEHYFLYLINEALM